MEEKNERKANSYCVYIHTSPSDKHYVGLTKRDPEKRWCNGKAYASNIHFRNAINKYGWNNFKHIIVATNLTRDEACKLEVELIYKLNSYKSVYGYNRSLGGECSKYYIVSDAIKKQMSEAHIKKGHWKGENNFAYGKSPKERLSKEVYEKWITKTQYRLRNVLNVNAKKVININTQKIFNSTVDAAKYFSINDRCVSKCCRGEMWSAGHDSTTGEALYWAYYQKNNDYSKKSHFKNLPRSIICIESGEIFGCAADVTVTYGFDSSSILKCCRGTYKTSYGFHWEFYAKSFCNTYKQKSEVV